MNTHFPSNTRQAAVRARFGRLPAVIGIVALIGTMTAGCVTETRVVGPNGKPVYKQVGTGAWPAPDRVQVAYPESPGSSASPAAPASPPRLVVQETGSGSQAHYLDQCSDRLHNLGGNLLEFYMLYSELPAKLDDLRPFAMVDTDMDFKCPVSHVPYVYNPVGLQPPGGGERRIILYDATPVHMGPDEHDKSGPDVGRRWCVMWVPAKVQGPNGKRSFEVFAVDLSEAEFRRYTPAAAPMVPVAQAQAPAAPGPAPVSNPGVLPGAAERPVPLPAAPATAPAQHVSPEQPPTPGPQPRLQPELQPQ